MYTVLPRLMVSRELYMTKGVKCVLMDAMPLLISLDKFHTNVKALDSLDPTPKKYILDNLKKLISLIIK
jgi:hypothetical protein